MKVHVVILVFMSILNVSFAKTEKQKSFHDTMSVIDEYSQILKGQEQIRNSSYGLDYAGEDKVYDEKIHVIALGYRVDKHMRYDEASNYFYSIVDGLLAHINKNVQIKKYFFHFPVNYSDLELNFSFEDGSQGALKHDEVKSIHIARNKILYEIVNEEESNDIQYDQVSPEIYVLQNGLEKNRSIIRTIAEDLAIHSKGESQE